MTREEAMTVFEAFINNPLFSDVHKAAFNIAIHDIKQRHDWDINNLILVNKDNYEALEQEPVIDKIRAEIDKARFVDKDTRICKNALASGLEVAMQIIDKYKAETEKA